MTHHRPIDVGDQVLAWDETTGATGYYTVTATMAHVDSVVVHLTINGETIATTPEHPFYERETAPWLAVGDAHTYVVGDVGWVAAKALYLSSKRVISVLYLDHTTRDDRK